MPQRVTVNLVVNGATYEREVEPRILLSDFLRHELRLTGTMSASRVLTNAGEQRPAVNAPKNHGRSR